MSKQHKGLNFEPKFIKSCLLVFYVCFTCLEFLRMTRFFQIWEVEWLPNNRSFSRSLPSWFVFLGCSATMVKIREYEYKQEHFSTDIRNSARQSLSGCKKREIQPVDDKPQKITSRIFSNSLTILIQGKRPNHLIDITNEALTFWAWMFPGNPHSFLEDYS